LQVSTAFDFDDRDREEAEQKCRNLLCPYRHIANRIFRTHGLHNEGNLENSGMPWKEGKPMDEKLRFIARLLEGEKMAPLCREFGISRVTGYKIFNRYKECGLDALFELFRGSIAQCRMQLATIVVPFDKFLDIFSQVIQVAVLVGVNLFPLQRLDEAFATGVVVRVGRPAHAGDHLMVEQNPHVFARSVLHAAIGVMNQAGRRLPLSNCLF